MVKRSLLVITVLLVLCLGFNAAVSASFTDAKFNESKKEKSRVALYQDERASSWKEVSYSLVLPGSSHVRFGKWKRGLFYSATELSCIYYGFKGDKENKEAYMGLFILLSSLEVGEVKRMVDNYNHSLLKNLKLSAGKNLKLKYSTKF